MSDVIRVLLIEDDEDDYFLTSDYLQGCEEPKFQLTWVTNSADAIDALQRRNFDLCLLDYLLGAENAVDVLDVLKSNQFSLPVIILNICFLGLGAWMFWKGKPNSHMMM